MTGTTSDDHCGLCGSTDEQRHRHLEATGILHHKWSIAGELVQVDRAANNRKKTQPPNIVVAVDLPLRQLLHAKGVLTDEDLAALFNPGHRPSRDLPAGETPGTE